MFNILCFTAASCPCAYLYTGICRWYTVGRSRHDTCRCNSRTCWCTCGSGGRRRGLWRTRPRLKSKQPFESSFLNLFFFLYPPSEFRLHYLPQTGWIGRLWINLDRKLQRISLCGRSGIHFTSLTLEFMHRVMQNKLSLGYFTHGCRSKECCVC